MGRGVTTGMLCAASMIGSALIASQGFRPDPIAVEEDASLSARCEALDDDHARARIGGCEGGPHERGRAVVDEVVDHRQPSRRQARVVAVLPGEPCVEVHAAFQGQPLPASVRGDTRSASRLRSN